MTPTHTVGAIVVVTAACVLAFAFGPLGALPVLALATVVVFGGAITSAHAGLRVTPSAPEESSHTDGRVPPLRNLVIAALGVRILGAFVFNLTGFNVAVAPDSVGYAIYGELLALIQEQPHLETKGLVAGLNPNSFHQQLNAVGYRLFGSHVGIALSLVNAVVGTLAAWLFAQLAAAIYTPSAARPAFILCGFWPSIVLWTSINLRDAWSFLLLGAALLAAQRLRTAATLRDAIILGACLLAYPFVRGYMLVLLSVGLIASYMVVRVRQLPIAIILVAGILLALTTLKGPYAVLGDLSVEGKLEQLHRMRSGLAYGASAFDSTGVDLSTPLGALTYLPRGLANFLLAPFPWKLQSWRQIMALPETFVWYAILAAAIRQAWSDVRYRLKSTALIVFVSVSITVAYSLVEGNEGTAYRHRAHVLLLAFVFAAGFWARRRERTHAGSTGSTQLLPNAGSIQSPDSAGKIPNLLRTSS